MPLLKRVRVMAAKIETTVGTDVSPGASDGAFNAYDVMIQPGIGMTQREGQGAFNRLTSVPEAYNGTMTFKTDLGWDGTDTDPTWATVLLPACGFVPTAHVYAPVSEAPGGSGGVKTVTIGCWEDGKLKKLTGAVGNVKFVFESGKMCTAEWEFKGVWVTPTSTAIIAPTYPTATPLRFASAAACTFNSVALAIQSMTIDLGNEIVMREDPTKAGGLISGIITDRVPKITCNPEAVLAATQDRDLIWLGMTEYTISVSLDCPTTATLIFTAPKAQIINIQEGDRGKMVTDEIEFQCNKNGSGLNQELAIWFTAAV